MAKSKGRAHGEGSIFQRKRPSGALVWVGVIPAGWRADGKRRRRTVYGATQAEVVEKLAELRAEKAEGLVADPGRLTVSELVKRYLEHAERTTRATTAAGYRDLLERHVTPHLGGAHLARLAPVHVLDWLRVLERAEVGARSRQQSFDVFKRALAFGVDVGLLSRNPAARVKRPRAPKPEIRSLAAAQARKLLEKAREGPAWVEAAVALGLCGLRRGETFGLAWRDVDLEAGTVRVRQALTETAGSKAAKVASVIALSEPKSKSARREVPLPGFALAALRRHRAELGAVPLPSLLVFRSDEGTPVRFSNFARRHFGPLVTKAEGVPKGTTYHALRHTAATLLLAGGADVKSAQAILGHAKASHTLDLYADSVPGNVEAAMRALGSAL